MTEGYMLVRLRDAGQDDYRIGRKLISSYRSNRPRHDYFLHNHAIFWEKNGIGNTYLLVNGERRTEGFFTVNAGPYCAYDKPVFEISHLGCTGGKNCFGQRQLIGLVKEMMDRCSSRIGPVDLMAKCTSEELRDYESQGFTYLGNCRGNYHRMVCHL